MQYEDVCMCIRRMCMCIRRLCVYYEDVFDLALQLNYTFLLAHFAMFLLTNETL